MNNINLNLITKSDLSPNSRYVMKKGQLHIEQGKPNLFVRAWRHLRGQYNHCKIARLAMNLFGEQNGQLHHLAQDKRFDEGYRALKNVKGIVDTIPLKSKKCRQKHQEMSAELEKISKQFKQTHQDHLDLLARKAREEKEAAARQAKKAEEPQNTETEEQGWLGGGLAQAWNANKERAGKMLLAGVRMVAGEAGTAGLAHAYQAVSNPNGVSAMQRVQHGLTAVTCMAYEGFVQSVNPYIRDVKHADRAAELYYGID